MALTYIKRNCVELISYAYGTFLFLPVQIIGCCHLSSKAKNIFIAEGVSLFLRSESSQAIILWGSKQRRSSIN